MTVGEAGMTVGEAVITAGEAGMTAGAAPGWSWGHHHSIIINIKEEHKCLITL